MAAGYKHAGRSAVSPEGSEAPKRKVKRSPKAVSAEPKVEISSPSLPDIVEPLPPTKVEISSPSLPDIVEPLPPIVEATATPSPAPNPDPLLEHVSEKPIFESRWSRWSPAPSVEPVHPSVAAANPTPEHLENLARKRLVWGVIVAVLWTETVVALLLLHVI